VAALSRTLAPQLPGAARWIRARARSARRGEGWWGLVYVLPALAVVGLFVIYPLGRVFYYSLTRWDGITAPAWIGLGNFRALWHDPLFRSAIKNNLIFALAVPIQMTVPLGLAYAIYVRVPGWRLFRATFFLPAVLSTVVVGILAQQVFSFYGPVNSLLRAVGLSNLERDWLATPDRALGIILIVVLWATFGYNVIIYLAGMSALDPALREAALIDGAGHFRTLFRVIAPNLRRVIELVMVTSTVTVFAFMFTYIYVITNGGPGFSTYTTDFLIFQEAFALGQMGYACAVAVVLTSVTALLGLVQIRLLTGRRS
jgi:multiple sugar transport system permease protein